MDYLPYPRDDPARRSLRLHEWPAPDREAWLRAVAPADLLDDGGDATTWSPVPQRGVIKGYGAWLGHLQRRGALDAEAHPEMRVTAAAVEDYIAELRQRSAPISVRARVATLASAVTVMVPKTDWTWLWSIERRLLRHANAARTPKDRLVPVAHLLQLGQHLMAEAERAVSERPDYRAARFRDGLMVALLATRAVRLKNLAGIRIGQNLLPLGTGYRLLFRAGETKTGVELDYILPQELIDPMNRYQAVYRETLLRLHPRPDAGPTDGLWISIFGEMMSMPGIYWAITTRTRGAFGFPVNPHRFRHCSVTSAAMLDPDHARMSMAILGHTNTVTANRYYNNAPSAAAAAQFQRELQNIVAELGWPRRTRGHST